jgi:DNA-binding HxlR family transcriptional regulator
VREQERAALADAAGRIGDRWSLQVVHALLGGPRRFGELEEEVPGIASNVLSQRLKALERDGVLLAEPYQHRPLRHAYALTARGRELAGALRLLAAWAVDERSAPAHDACGSALHARWWCPTCDATVEDDEGRDLTWV